MTFQAWVSNVDTGLISTYRGLVEFPHLIANHTPSLARGGRRSERTQDEGTDAQGDVKVTGREGGKETHARRERHLCEVSTTERPSLMTSRMQFQSARRALGSMPVVGSSCYRGDSRGLTPATSATGSREREGFEDRLRSALFKALHLNVTQNCAPTGPRLAK